MTRALFIANHLFRRAASARLLLILLILLLWSTTTFAATRTWSGAVSNAWGTAGNWQENVIPVAGDDLVFPAGASNLAMNNNRTAATSFNSLTFSGNGYSVTGNSITLAGPITVSATGGSNSIGINMVTTAVRTITVTDVSETLTISSVMSGSNGGISKAGAGILRLLGINTFTGAVNITVGTLIAAANQALGSSAGGATVSAGAALGFDGTITYSAAEAITINGSGTAGEGALYNVSGTNSFAGAITLGSASTIGSSAGALTTGGALVNGGFLLSIAGAGNITLSGLISGTGGLTKNDSGTLTIGAANGTNNTYNGTTTVNGGELDLNMATKTDAFEGPLVIGDGVGTDVVKLLNSKQFGLVTTVTINSSGTLNLNNFDQDKVVPVFNGGAITTGTGLMTLGGDLTVNASATTATISGLMSVGGAARNFIIADGSAANDLSISAVISGAQGIAKTGAGRLVLSGANTHSSTWTISGGQVQLQNVSALGTTLAATTVSSGAALELSSGLTFAAEPLTLNGTGVGGSGALLNVSGNNTWAGPLTIGSATTFGSTSGTMTVSPAIANVGFLLTATGAGNTTFNGVISGAGAFTKTGSGTTTLAGTNTFSGITAINSGILSIAADANLGTAPASATPSQLTLNGGTLATTATFTLNANRGVALSSTTTVDVASGTTLTYAGIATGAGGLTKASAGTLSLGSATLTIGDFILSAGTVVAPSTNLFSVGGNWTNNGTFTHNSGIVTLAGSGAIVSGSGAQNFNNLTITGPGVSFPSSTISVAGNLATTGSGSCTQASGGTFSLTGTSKTISGSGISIDNLSVSGSVGTTSTLTLTGNLSVAGSLTASAGTITMSGNSKTISGAGTKSFNQLFIGGAITTDADFSIVSGLTVNGSLSASAGTATFTGTSTLSGAANLYNATVNGTSLQLAATSTLGIANAFTITAGTLNVTSSIPNTINFNGAGAQNVNGITYDNLTISGGNTKTAAAGVTVNRDLTILNGTTFAAGSYTHTFYRDLINNGTFSAGTSTIQFIGTETSNINGATTFNILTVNKTASTSMVSLGSNVSASTVNMTAGKLATGVNTITITNTRTGNAKIYGNIQRTHSFTTGAAYAFEGPDNTITFSSVSGVSTITVSVVEGSVSDFPFGSAINEQYTIAIPSGTYSATLRLDYEDDELNGNDESTMTLWSYNGSSWVNSGKTANDTSADYVEHSGLTSIAGRWTLSNPGGSSVVQWNGSVSTDWNTAGNWTILQGSGSRPPSSADVVYLGTAAFTYQPIISNAVSVKQIGFGSAQAVALSLSSGGSLTTGNINGTWTSNATHTINANSQLITVNGDLALSDGTNGHAINLNIGSGTVTVHGDIVQSGDANIIFSGAGNLNLGHDFDYLTGTFTAGSGTVTYIGDGNQSIGGVNYNHLTINKGASATINSPITVGGDFSVVAGIVDNLSTTTIYGAVNISSGASLFNHLYLHVKGDWVNNGTFAPTANASMFFDGSGTQNISASTFNNLNINKPVGSSAVLTGDLVINGDLTMTSGTFNIKTFACNRSVQGGTITIADNATFIVGGNNAPTNFSNGSLSNASTVIADGTGPQAIFGESFGNLVFRNSGVKTLVAPITVNGDLTIENGATFDGGTQTLTLNGDWINNGTFTASTGTVVFSGVSKNISGNTTFNLMTVSGSYTALSDFTCNDAVSLTATGSLAAGSSRTFTFGGDVNTNGVASIDGTVVLTGTRTQTIHATNSTSRIVILTLNGTVAPVFSGTETPTFGVLNINNTGGISPDTSWTVLLALNIASGASFNGGALTHNIGGSLTNNGTITSSGTLNFNPSSAATVTLGSGFSSSGTVNFGGTDALALAGSSGTFHDVVIANSNGAGITPSSDWTITNNLTINSGAILNASNRSYFVGGNLSNTGTINSGNSTFTLNGTTTQDIYSASALNNLTINKAADIVTLSSDATVNGVLNFVAGKIQTGNYHLIEQSSATVTGAGQTSGWVNGNLQKNIPTGSSSRTFEVGGPGNYSPVTTAFAGVTSAGNLTASAISGDHANIGTSTIDAAKSVNRTWTLTNNGVVFASYDATFNFVAGDVDAGLNTNAVKVGSYNGGSWTYATVGTKTSTSTQATGLTTFGEFQIGATSSIPNVALILSVTPNGTVAPRTDLVYTINFTNSGAGTASAFVITDPIPANTDFKLGSATTSLGTTGLTPTISYSSDGGTTWSYTPVSGGGGAPAGYDRNVTHVRWNFGSSLSQTSPNNTGSVNVTTRIR